MKLLILFLSFITMFTPITLDTTDDIQNRFLDEVEKNYECYNVEKTIEFEEFSLVIVKGIYNNCGCYGVSFVPAESNTYTLVLETSDSSFTLPTSNNALAIKADITYEIIIYDKNNSKLNIEKIVLQKFNKDDFDKNTAIEGNGEGVRFTALQSYATRLRYLPVLLITLASLIVITVILILLLFVFKKGLFNKEKRREGVVSMRDIYEAETNDTYSDGISFDEVQVEDNQYIDNSNDTTNIPVINPNKRDDEDSTDSKIEDIKAYLQDHGFVVDYKVLDESEKNKIMMELIKLKNEGLISMDAYYKETYELWKK
ncbi:MAG: hypothetical protein J5666_06380 [Bacilli bacterium]|nr:hypothetical protein [Bacilli bacterium]